MNKSLQLNPQRIVLVDVMRGFAVMAIMLLHFIEHFIYNVYPKDSSPFVAAMDKSVWDALFFVFAGKSYAIFALLFGFTFAVQYNNQQSKGKDFSGRFAWRLLLLFLFGCLNSIFFPGGDVLVLFAITGLFLIPIRRLPSKTLFYIALFFLLQPIEIFNTFASVINPDFEQWQPWSKVYNMGVGEIYSSILKPATESGDFLHSACVNLTAGQFASLAWALEGGRFMQTIGLFIIGVILARGNYFVIRDSTVNFWIKVLLISLVSTLFLYIAKSSISFIEPMSVGTNAVKVFTMWYNLAFTSILVSSFALLFTNRIFIKMTVWLQFYGRMSLTNYISQSIIGAIIFFPFALNLAPLAGITASFLIGIAIMIIQVWICRWWLSSHKQGPLEFIWGKATWI